jgi:segregation and condensation protein A
MSVVYSVGSFQGPLELLLSLIESEKMPISEVSLARVAEQFLQYVRSMPQFDADTVSRFLSIAATLVAIKAQSLLPVLDTSEEVEADIGELEHRLRMYAALRECVKVLEKHYHVCKPLFARPSGWSSHYSFIPDNTITISSIQNALHDVLEKSVEVAEDAHSSLPEVRIRSVKSLEEVMDAISKTVQGGAGYTLSSKGGFSDAYTRAEALISFLAILELVRSGIVSADQGEYHDDIVVSTLTR